METHKLTGDLLLLRPYTTTATKIILLLLLLFLAATSTTHSQTTDSSASDLEALLAFKAQVVDPDGVLQTNWTSDSSFCTNWLGISCGQGQHRQRVVAIRLRDLDLRGTISPHFGNLTFLSLLDLTNCSLLGPVPPSLGRLNHLQELVLLANELTGGIPSSLARCGALKILSFSSNNLAGAIPTSLWSLTNLTQLNLSRNALDGLLPDQVDMMLLTNLKTLDLSANRFSGKIPDALGRLGALTHLDLSYNSLQGEIPESLGRLLNIQYFNFSHNLLSGPIPESVANLPRLSSLGLSYNNLEGQIPEGGVFSNLTVSSLEGNFALCGAPQLYLSPCHVKAQPSSGSKEKSRSVKYILVVVFTTVVVVAGLCLMLAFCWLKKVKNTVNVDDMPDIDFFRAISHLDLVRATDNFNSSNLIGRGRFCSVYQGRLDDGLIVAVKILNLKAKGASKSFAAECQVLSMVRHRNLVKIITVCSNMDFKALVLPFMRNGSLDKWLHDSDSNHLSLLQRLNIMIDVSTALEYLHHHHHETVLHRDLKPSNVLLDEGMTAYVSDFGIAKLVFGVSTSLASTRNLGTIGYIPPEYDYGGTVSRMGDVYSFGILLLETFTGRKPIDRESSLRDWVCKSYPAALLDIVDGCLLNDISGEEQRSEDAATCCLSSVIEVGLLCSSFLPAQRIPMLDVVPRLCKARQELVSGPSAR